MGPNKRMEECRILDDEELAAAGKRIDWRKGVDRAQGLFKTKAGQATVAAFKRKQPKPVASKIRTPPAGEPDPPYAPTTP
jgi:hypothetical protein